MIHSGFWQKSNNYSFGGSGAGNGLQNLWKPIGITAVFACRRKGTPSLENLGNLLDFSKITWNCGFLQKITGNQDYLRFWGNGPPQKRWYSLGFIDLFTPWATEIGKSWYLIKIHWIPGNYVKFSIFWWIPAKNQIFAVLGGPGQKTGSRTYKNDRNYCCFYTSAQRCIFM